MLLTIHPSGENKFTVNNTQQQFYRNNIRVENQRERDLNVVFPKKSG